jgi:tetratricopeptide (TPR) repeat protein
LAAQVNLAADQPEAALRHARTALGQNPRDFGLYLIQVDALNRLGRPSEATALMQRLLKEQPRLVAVRRALANQLAGQGQWDAALKTCREGRREVPEAFGLVTDELVLLCRRKRVEEAQQVAREAVGEPPDASKCLGVARAFLKTGQLEIARQWGQRALELADDGQKPAVHLLLGEIALNEPEHRGDAQQMDRAREHFTAVIQSQPQNLVAGNNLSWLLAAHFGQPEEAVRIAEQTRGKATVAQLPVFFIDTLGFAYRKANRLDDAQQLLEEALAIKENEPQLQFQLGMALAEANRAAAARGALERALELGLSDEKTAEAKRQLAALEAGIDDNP